MPLHPILADKLQAALRAVPARTLTPRDARLPTVAGKVHSVIGMRRAGKTTFLHQLQVELHPRLAFPSRFIPFIPSFYHIPPQMTRSKTEMRPRGGQD